MQPIIDEIRFEAEEAIGHEEEYTPDFTVYGIYFGNGDPEEGGEVWNFTRAFDENNWGVCTVKEIQAVTVYGGIVECILTRQYFACAFDKDTQKETGVGRLHISFNVSDEVWKNLAQQARMVFKGERYFRLET